MDIKEELARKHLPFVTSIVKKYNVDRDDYEDMFAEGCIGLVHAINTWEESRDVKFMTYAYYCIRSSIIDYLRKQTRYENREKTGFYSDAFLDVSQPDSETAMIQKEQATQAYQELELIAEDLTDREKYVLHHHVLADKPETLRDIAVKFNTTHFSILRDKQRVVNTLEGGVANGNDATSDV